MRPVRLADSAHDDLERQIPLDRLTEFRVHDLRPALHLLATAEAPGDYLADAGPVTRYTVHGTTVAGFHLFIAPDELDPRDGALVVIAIDVWLEEFPD